MLDKRLKEDLIVGLFFLILGFICVAIDLVGIKSDDIVGAAGFMFFGGGLIYMMNAFISIFSEK